MKTFAGALLALLALSSAARIRNIQSLSINQSLRQRGPSRSFSSFNRRPPPPLRPLNLECLNNPYRTLGGECNNVRNPEWGAREQPFCFIARPVTFTKEEVDALPSARLISNVVCEEASPIPNSRRISELFTFFGQLIDHTVTEISVDDDRPWPIKLPDNEPVFPPGDLPFWRSTLVTSDGPNRRTGPRNILSSYIDAVSIYGPDERTLSQLRLNVSGKLLLDSNGFLPKVNGLFISGDIRVNENPLLTSLHTLFSREHNRVAEQVLSAFPNQNDEQIFQTTRRIIDAEMAAIVYYEFLPAITGRQLSPYRRYDPTIEACISNTFSTVGFRVGHTLLNSRVTSKDENGKIVNERMLSDSFFVPEAFEKEGMDNLIRGMFKTRAAEVDNGITPEVRDFLLQSENSMMSHDLAALNIQRARDHGVPPYNALRTFYGLPRVNDFSEITSNPVLQARLEAAYNGNINIVDPWIGGISEDRTVGSLGNLFGRIWLREFERLRDGDRFYFENNIFSADEIRKLDIVNRLVGNRNLIGKVMQFVIQQNTGIRNVPENPFFV